MSGRRVCGLPLGFRVSLDARTTILDERTIVGGEPRRVVHLSPAGARAWDELRVGVGSPSAGELARYLTDVGLAHPDPPAGPPAPDITVVVPVRDRPDQLEHCLTRLGRSVPVVVVDDGSADAAAVRRIAERHGAKSVRRECSGGPAVARNDGLRACHTDFVAFVDSDCVPGPAWTPLLMPHFADPLVGAVAPRIVPARHERPAHRYATRFGALDQGAQAGRVRPGARVSYVPTAALVVRRAALDSIASDGYVFDPSLRYGEDVDVVWRLHAAGWRVRYDPAVEVAHDEPLCWRAVFARRFRYGTSAGPLSHRHPEATRPLVLAPVPALAVGALAARRPGVAAAAVAVASVRMSRPTGLPLTTSTRMTAAAVVATWRGVGRYACQFLLPVVAVVAGLPGRGRPWRAAAAAVFVAGGLDSLRYAPARIADHASYGAGVWVGCRTERTLRPLRPTVVRSATRMARSSEERRY